MVVFESVDIDETFQTQNHLRFKHLGPYFPRFPLPPNIPSFVTSRPDERVTSIVCVYDDEKSLLLDHMMMDMMMIEENISDSCRFFFSTPVLDCPRRRQRP